jgi:hypothetical protein
MAWIKLRSGRTYPMREAVITHGATVTTERAGTWWAIELEEVHGKKRVWRIELKDGEAIQAGLTIHGAPSGEGG